MWPTAQQQTLPPPHHQRAPPPAQPIQQQTQPPPQQQRQPPVQQQQGQSQVRFTPPHPHLRQLLLPEGVPAPPPFFSRPPPIQVCRVVGTLLLACDLQRSVTSCCSAGPGREPPTFPSQRQSRVSIHPAILGRTVPGERLHSCAVIYSSPVFVVVVVQSVTGTVSRFLSINLRKRHRRWSNNIRWADDARRRGRPAAG